MLNLFPLVSTRAPFWPRLWRIRISQWTNGSLRWQRLGCRRCQLRCLRRFSTYLGLTNPKKRSQLFRPSTFFLFFFLSPGLLLLCSLFRFWYSATLLSTSDSVCAHHCCLIHFLDRIQFSSLVFSLTQPFQLAVIKSHLTFESENLFR